MSLQEAKQFVAQFIKGDYTPEEYAAFLRWLKGATLDELNEIADEHESKHDQWVAMAATPAIRNWSSESFCTDTIMAFSLAGTKA